MGFGAKLLLFIYSLLMGLYQPFFSLFSGKKVGKKDPSFLEKEKSVIWIHAVSMGETLACSPILYELNKTYPHCSFLITSCSLIGHQTAMNVFIDRERDSIDCSGFLKNSVQKNTKVSCLYLPMDAPWICRRFLTRYNLFFGMLVETEVWPNFILTAKKLQLPLFLGNGRLSEKSWSQYSEKGGFVFKNIFPLFSLVMSQSEIECERFRELGARNVVTVGNSKYDVKISQKAENAYKIFQDKLKNNKRKIAVLGSTRESKGVDEAFLILDAWVKDPRYHDYLLVIVPRHDKRYEPIYQKASELGLNVCYRSSDVMWDLCDVVIGDSVGEMLAYYKIADAVFVGGSLVNTGCQNMIEPIMMSKMPHFGFSTYNFQAATGMALKNHLAKQVQTPQELVNALIEYMNIDPSDPFKVEFKSRSEKFIRENMGSAKRTVEEIQKYFAQKKENE